MDWSSNNNTGRQNSSSFSPLSARSSSKLTSLTGTLKNVSNDFSLRGINSSVACGNVLNSPGLRISKKLDDFEGAINHVPSKSDSSIPLPTSTMILDKFRNETFANELSPYQENVGGTIYFYQYSENPLHSGQQNDTNKSEKKSWYMSEELRADILNRNILTMLQVDRSDLGSDFSHIPQELDNYHDLYPLENTSNSLRENHIGYQSSMYKATQIKSGNHFCLRRIHGFRLQNSKCMSLVDQWKKVVHCNVVQLKEVFTTKAFGDNSLMFVYDYYPGSETLLSKYFSSNEVTDPFLPNSGTPRPYSFQKNNLLRHQQNNKVPETLIWNYIIQLTSALRIIHSSSLACRSLDPTKIILTSKHWLRVSCLGTIDVLQNENISASNHAGLIQHYQQEDLMALGKLVLALACRSTSAIQRDNISTAIDVVGCSYSPDLRNLIMYLLTNQRRSVTDLMPMIGARFYTHLDHLNCNIDFLYNELSKELQNGRLFRLLAKLATINERPDFNMDNSWSETGDRYMLKLFRDYIFHQVSDDGHPWTDMAHIVHCFNKLEAGSCEKICLMSRDEQSILVVSFAELKQCLDQSFQEIINLGSHNRNADTKT